MTFGKDLIRGSSCGIRVSGVGVRAWGLRFAVSIRKAGSGSDLRVSYATGLRNPGYGLWTYGQCNRVERFGIRVQAPRSTCDWPRMAQGTEGLGVLVSGFGSRVSRFGVRGLGLGFRA